MAVVGLVLLIACSNVAGLLWPAPRRVEWKSAFGLAWAPVESA